MGITAIHPTLFPELESPRIPALATGYPEFRYIGSKHRLMLWVFETLRGLDFESALAPFCGSSCVNYLLKCMGKRVVSSDFLKFPATFTLATVENSSIPAGILNAGHFAVTPQSWIKGVERVFGPGSALDFRVRLTHGVSPNWIRLGPDEKPGVLAPLLHWEKLLDSQGGVQNA